MRCNITLSIVFLNFNRVEETRVTTEKLLAMVAHRPDIEIIAVDNNSTDGTAEYLKAQQGIQTVLLPTNDGIAGYNEGFSRAAGEYILVLDDDSCPADMASLDALISRLHGNPEIGVVACHIETPDGEPQWKWHLPAPYSSGESPFFIGCGFAIRTKLFEEIGWYPGDFFLYQNEIDIAFKVRKRGFGIYYDAEVRVIHRGILSSRPGWRCVYYPTRNTIWIIRKYYPFPQAGYMVCSRLLIGLGRAVYLLQMKAYFKALRDAFARKVEREPLSPEMREISNKFYLQNSIIHQLFRKI